MVTLEAFEPANIRMPHSVVGGGLPSKVAQFLKRVADDWQVGLFHSGYSILPRISYSTLMPLSWICTRYDMYYVNPLSRTYIRTHREFHSCQISFPSERDVYVYTSFMMSYKPVVRAIEVSYVRSLQTWLLTKAPISQLMFFLLL